MLKRVLLVSNEVFIYRIGVYNAFADRFAQKGYEFHVLSNKYQGDDENCRFIKHEQVFSIPGYCKKIDEIKPHAVIVFLHLKDTVQIPVVLHCRRVGIPVIYWNKGLAHNGKDFKRANPWWKVAAYHFIHNRCDALITYTPETKAEYALKNWGKLFVAPNTISFEEIDKAALPDRAAIKKKYGIRESKVVLFTGTMSKKAKRPELLFNALANVEDVAVVFMGGNPSRELLEKIADTSNAYYLGQLYGLEGNEIWSIADVFSTPGNIGLAINEAMFWNIPVALVRGNHPPELFYMRDGITGFIAKDDDDYKRRLRDLINNDAELIRMSENCEMVYRLDISIERMFQGFYDAIRYATSR